MQISQKTLMKPEIVTRPAPPSTDYATREWVETVLDRKLDRALRTSEESTHRIVSGFAARLFKQFPKAIAQAIMDANPELTLSPHALTHAIEQVFAQA